MTPRPLVALVALLAGCAASGRILCTLDGEAHYVPDGYLGPAGPIQLIRPSALARLPEADVLCSWALPERKP